MRRLERNASGKRVTVRWIAAAQRRQQHYRKAIVGVDLEFFVEKVLEKLGTTENTTLAVKREVSGKIRVASLL
jgi:hypothetical protein